MSHRRDISAWMLEPSSRLTISQQIGGAYYDFIASYPPIRLTTGKTWSLLTCIRISTGMSDRTLKRLFLGKSDSMNDYFRLRFAIQGWIPDKEFQRFTQQIDNIKNEYGTNEGTAFLEEMARKKRPKRKALTPLNS